MNISSAWQFPFILTLCWKSFVSWIHEIFSFRDWTKQSRASSRMKIYSLGMNHLTSQGPIMLHYRKFHRSEIWPIPNQSIVQHFECLALPQMNEFKFIFAKNSKKIRKMNMVVYPMTWKHPQKWVSFNVSNLCNFWVSDSITFCSWDKGKVVHP